MQQLQQLFSGGGEANEQGFDNDDRRSGLIGNSFFGQGGRGEIGRIDPGSGDLLRRGGGRITAAGLNSGILSRSYIDRFLSGQGVGGGRGFGGASNDRGGQASQGFSQRQQGEFNFGPAPNQQTQQRQPQRRQIDTFGGGFGRPIGTPPPPIQLGSRFGFGNNSINTGSRFGFGR